MQNRIVSNISFIIGIFAMLLLIYAISFLSLGSMLQRLLLFAGALMLLAVAYAHKQRVLIAVELVVVTGGIVSLLPISLAVVLITMTTVSLILIGYLFKVGHYKKEPIGIFGTLGFLMLAFGYAMNFGANTLYAAVGLGLGAVLLMLYSTMHYYLYKVRVQIIWAVLNAAFAISPLLFLLSIKAL